MKGWAQAVFLLCTTVLASVVSSIDTNVIEKSAASGAGSADGGNSYSLKYLIPCDHCSNDPENTSAQIDLSVSAANLECGSENTLFVNGLPLPYTVWHHSIKQWITFSANSSDPAESAVEIKAYLQLGCLNADTSIISLSLAGSEKEDRVTDRGFTVSFKQQNQAREVRYKAVPIADIDIVDVDLEWGDPESRGGLIREFQELQLIEMAIDHLHERHSRRRQRIKDLIVKEFKACDSLYCYMQKAKESAPYLSSLIKTLFCQKYTAAMGQPNIPDQIALSTNKFVHDQPHKHEQAHSVDHLPGQNHPNRPLYGNPHGNHNSLNVDSQPPDYQRPPFFRQHRFPIIVSLVVTILIILSIVFVFIKVAKGGISWCIGPRMRRDYAARREERRTRAAYRRAACRQKVKRWWSSLRKPSPTSDYDEKRARILTQEGILENVMQDEIAQLQRAHEIANDMVRAEEGRARLHHQVNFGVQTAPIYIDRRGGLRSITNENGEGSSAGPNSITTLPLYTSPPPSYQSDFQGEMTIVDGFNYTPSNSDNTSESSVVDCTSRLSFDTDSIGTRD